MNNLAETASERDYRRCSALELLMPEIYDAWTTEIASRTDTERLLLGYSIGKHPVHYLVANPVANDVLLLVGRQHPPEFSGAFAFFRLWKHCWRITSSQPAFATTFRSLRSH